MTRRRAIGRGLAALVLGAVLGAAPAGAAPAAAIMDAGLASLAAADYEAAERAFRQVLAQDPRNPVALRQLGVAYLAEGRLREGFSTLQTARVLTPDDPRVHFYLAQLYYQAGLPDRERAELKQAIALRPGFREAHLQLAHALVTSGELYAAAFEYTWLLERAEAAGAAPEPLVLFNLAAIRDRMDRPAEAAALFERYLRAVPEGAQADRARGRLAQLAQRTGDAPRDAAGPP